ncbi:MAG: ferritin-like domain-containing protein [Bacteroidota bacterium]
MQTSQQWIDYFRKNLQNKRIDWSVAPKLSEKERKNIVQGIQAWQLGETSDGAHLLAASKKYAGKTGDNYYCEAVELFIKEEQKHGNNLGHYLDLIGEKRITHNWGDTLFRKIRYFNTSMELWTITVIIVESTAQIFYQSLKDATGCILLKQVCTDILIDEAAHINFQLQRLVIIFSVKPVLQKIICFQLYRIFYFSVILVVWAAHHKLFKAGNNNIFKYLGKMNLKFKKTIQKLQTDKSFNNTQSKNIITISHPV